MALCATPWVTGLRYPVTMRYVDPMRTVRAGRISALLLTAALVATGCTSSTLAASTPDPTATPLEFADPTELPDQTPPTKVPTVTPVPVEPEPAETPTTTPTADADPSDVDLPDGFVFSDLQRENSNPLQITPISDPDAPFQYPDFEWWHHFAGQEEVDAFWLGLERANEEFRLDNTQQIEPDGLMAELIADGLIDPGTEAQLREARIIANDSFVEIEINNIVDLRVARDISGVMTIITCQQQAGQVVKFDTGEVVFELNGSGERLWFFAQQDTSSFAYIGVASRNGSDELLADCPNIDDFVDLSAFRVLAP